MESWLSIFQGILSTEGTFLDVYLDGLQECRSFDLQSNEGVELVQQISSLLTKTPTRPLGLRLLNKFLDQFSVDVLEKKGNLWTTLILKACNYQELQLSGPLVFDVLSKLIKRAQEIPDLTKTFTSTHICKVYESLTNVPPCQTKYALSCIEICLRSFPGSSGSSRGIIERFLWKNIDHIDVEVVLNCGKCLHLLQQVKGGGIQGINHKTQWKNYVLQLLGGIHSMYNEMFSNCIEMYEEKIEEEKLPWDKEQLQFDPAPVKKAAQMYMRCRNLIKYLIIALREPFPVERPVLRKKILNVINRGLSVNCIILEQNPIVDNIALSILLPKLHVDLLELLNVAVSISPGVFLSCYKVILDLVVDVLKWTSTKTMNTNLMLLREKVYETVSLWCEMFNNTNCCDSIAEFLFQEILSDITPTQSEFTLKVLSGSRKHMSKKARRLLHNAQNEKSNMAQNHSTNKRKEVFLERKSQKLCTSGLRCLQEVLFSVGNLIKPTILKMLQTNITKICATFYELPLKSTHLYCNINCRIEIYNTLYAIVMTPHHLCPPPTAIALKILQIAYTCDDSTKVRSHCSLTIRNIEKLIHPQKESLLFPIEARDIRNTFIKMGQESLLVELETFDALSNFNSIENENVLNLNKSRSELVTDIMIEPQTEEIVHYNKEQSMENIHAQTDIMDTLQNDELKYNEQIAETEHYNKEQTTKKIHLSTNVMANPQNDELNYNKEQQSVDNTASENTEQIQNENRVETFVNDKGTINDNGEMNTIYEEDSSKDFNSDEPIMKKQKLDNGNVLETENSENISYFNDMETDEDNLLADIASQFVDELN